MHNGFLKIGALLGAFTVLLGAFAAHTIKARVTSELLSVFETGVRYQMYHTFILIITGILYKDYPTKYLLWAGKLFIWGIIFFCGSLYLLTYLKSIEAVNAYWVGAITPFGGLLFIAGWFFLFFTFFKADKNKQ
jgi:uncharacterized membrane protein YgdD (TMEM256/DUF423 family)